jgi:hypothetical protein
VSQTIGVEAPEAVALNAGPGAVVDGIRAVPTPDRWTLLAVILLLGMKSGARPTPVVTPGCTPVRRVPRGRVDTGIAVKLLEIRTDMVLTIERLHGLTVGR